MWLHPEIVLVLGSLSAVLCAHRYDSTRFVYPRRPTTTTESPPLLSSGGAAHKPTKYENLARINSRIDHFNKASSHRLRHHKWSDLTTTTTTTTENSVFNSYGVFEGDDADDDGEFDGDYNLDDADGEEDEERFEDDLDDINNADDNLEDSYNGWQAEEATEKPYKPMSAYSDYKWQTFGTREKVQAARKQEMRTEPSVDRLAREHYSRVIKEGACGIPKAKLVNVGSEYPDNRKQYTPHCTILHRCSEDTGCCNHGAYRCVYKTRESVRLYFFEKTSNMEYKVVNLTFYNHTACECRDITKNVTGIVDLGQRHKANTFRHATNLLFQQVPANLKGCKCPDNFKSKTAPCACDCAEDDKSCISLKKGHEHFSYKDRKCISEKQCGKPVCEHGVYNPDRGKCPTKQEQLEKYRRLSIT